MGGIVSGIGNAIGGIGGIASGVAGAIPGIGPIAGPIVGGLTGGPLGFASSLAGQALQGNYGGGGGSSGGTSSTTPMYTQPNINYGNNTYQYGTSPIDASKYFITGDRGVYNLLPAFGQVNAGNRANMYKPLGGKDLGRPGAYTSSEAYNDILAQMANDPKALSAFKTAYTPTAFNTKNMFGDISRFAPQGYKPGFEGFNRGRQMTPFDYANYYKTNPNPQQYVDYGLKANVPGQDALSYNKLAQYAVKNNNPFFLPYETTQGATATGFTPSASALAKDQAYYDYQNNLKKAVSSYYYPPTPVTPTPVTPPVIPRPVTPTPVTPTPVTPTPVTPTPVTPTPVQPRPPGNFTAMNRGGLASLRRS